MLRSRSTGGADDDGHQLRGLARSRKPHIRRFRLPAPVAVGIPERLEIGKSLPGKPTPFCRDVKSLSSVNAAPRRATRDRGNALNRRSLAFRFRHGLPSPSRRAGQRYGFPLSHRIGESALTHNRIVRCGREFFSCLLIFFDRVGRLSTRLFIRLSIWQTTALTTGRLRRLVQAPVRHRDQRVAVPHVPPNEEAILFQIVEYAEQRSPAKAALFRKVRAGKGELPRLQLLSPVIAVFPCHLEQNGQHHPTVNGPPAPRPAVLSPSPKLDIAALHLTPPFP